MSRHDPGAEPVEVLDETGAPAGVVTRREMRARNLWHRSVFVVVRNAAGDVLVHRRSDAKDLWPGRWDVAFGGVVDAGESWEVAAGRELREEAGISPELTYLGEGVYEDDDVREIGRVYAAEAEEGFAFVDGEVAEVAWVPARGLASWAADRTLCPDSQALVLPRLDAP